MKVPRWYQRRRLRRLLIGEGIAPELAEHMLRQQLNPQLLAQPAREEGVDIDAAFVTTNPEHNGFEVTCRGCGRTAKLPFQLPAGKVALCPDCMRAGRTGEE